MRTSHRPLGLQGRRLEEITFDPTLVYEHCESTLKNLILDFEPTNVEFFGNDVFDEAIRKAGRLETSGFEPHQSVRVWNCRYGYPIAPAGYH